MTGPYDGDDAVAAYEAVAAAVDLSNLRAAFLRRLPRRARILDAGCGPGHHGEAFQRLGHDVEAFDAAPAMVRRARRRLGRRVRCATFQRVWYRHPFDGIWAAASLLHLRPAELPGVMKRLAAFLGPRGWLYVSFKVGRGVRRLADGRWYTDLDAAGLVELVAGVPRLGVGELWIEADRLDGPDRRPWLNALLWRRPAGSTLETGRR